MLREITGDQWKAVFPHFGTSVIAFSTHPQFRKFANHNFESIRKFTRERCNVKDEDKVYREWDSFADLIAAHGFAVAECELVGYHPKPNGKRRKDPDLECKYGDVPFFAEVKHLSVGIEERIVRARTPSWVLSRPIAFAKHAEHEKVIKRIGDILLQVVTGAVNVGVIIADSVAYHHADYDLGFNKLWEKLQRGNKEYFADGFDGNFVGGIAEFESRLRQVACFLFSDGNTWRVHPTDCDNRDGRKVMRALQLLDRARV